ncbi:MAG TPA: ribosome small subunit-dependent GTPase A, partial [bacterium]|nr:ribosome small subunit-dependent GTPase A [bacterium]
TIAAFTGSSGVGKSTLINMLLGEERQKTAEISSAVKKGRHTTSSRDMIFLNNGAIVIDTPGIREIQMWETEVPEGFEKILELAAGCRFSDCIHDTEPDCAVKKAVSEGLLSSGILEMWRIQQVEMDELQQKKEESVKILESRKAKKRRS